MVLSKGSEKNETANVGTPKEMTPGVTSHLTENQSLDPFVFGNTLVIFLTTCIKYFHFVFLRYEAIISTKCILDFNLRI